MEVIGVNTLSISWETPSDMPDYPVPIAYNITYYEVLSDTVTLYSTVIVHVKVNETRRVQFENRTPGELYHYCVTAIYNNSNEASKCGSETIVTVTTLSEASGARLTEGILSLVIIILVVLLIVAGIGLAYPRCIRSRVK